MHAPRTWKEKCLSPKLKWANEEYVQSKQWQSTRGVASWTNAAMNAEWPHFFSAAAGVRSIWKDSLWQSAEVAPNVTETTQPAPTRLQHRLVHGEVKILWKRRGSGPLQGIQCSAAKVSPQRMQQGAHSHCKVPQRPANTSTWSKPIQMMGQHQTGAWAASRAGSGLHGTPCVLRMTGHSRPPCLDEDQQLQHGGGPSESQVQWLYGATGSCCSGMDPERLEQKIWARTWARSKVKVNKCIKKRLQVQVTTKVRNSQTAVCSAVSFLISVIEKWWGRWHRIPADEHQLKTSKPTDVDTHEGHHHSVRWWTRLSAIACWAASKESISSKRFLSSWKSWCIWHHLAVSPLVSKNAQVAGSIVGTLVLLVHPQGNRCQRPRIPQWIWSPKPHWSSVETITQIDLTATARRQACLQKG